MADWNHRLYDKADRHRPPREVVTPKVRKDGRCFVCKGPRPYTPNAQVPREQYLGDPFCSATCARKFYGTSLTYATKTST